MREVWWARRVVKGPAPGEYPKQKQPAPGVQAKMTPVPDCGEKSYVGSGRLKDRKATTADITFFTTVRNRSLIQI
ncbi:hypothetical protein C4869_24270 [Salmonella enterica subsp. enterica serovar Anatum]|nr:hypothetical protein C4869_24270 [Salmonella enterica subsp. enterica serovar Anatum]